MSMKSTTFRNLIASLGVAAALAFSSDSAKSNPSAFQNSKNNRTSDALIEIDKMGIDSVYIRSIQHFKDSNGHPIFGNFNDIYNAKLVGIDSGYLEVILSGEKNWKYPNLSGLDSLYLREDAKLLAKAENLIYMRLLHHYYLNDCPGNDIIKMVGNLKKDIRYDQRFSTNFWNNLLQ